MIDSTKINIDGYGQYVEKFKDTSVELLTLGWYCHPASPVFCHIIRMMIGIRKKRFLLKPVLIVRDVYIITTDLRVQRVQASFESKRLSCFGFFMSSLIPWIVSPFFPLIFSLLPPSEISSIYHRSFFSGWSVLQIKKIRIHQLKLSSSHFLLFSCPHLVQFLSLQYKCPFIYVSKYLYLSLSFSHFRWVAFFFTLRMFFF